MSKERYDFKVCMECQKKNTDVPCDENCVYIEEMRKISKN